MRAFLISMLVCFLSVQACQAPRSCNAAGCIDGAWFTLKTSDGTWADGAYALELTGGGVTHDCSMTLPDDLPANGGITSIPCDPPLGYLGVSLRADTVCTEHANGNSTTESCTPIPGHYLLYGSLAGTPNTLGIRVTRGEALLLEQTLPLSYAARQPNGPDCEPVCRQASVELALPEGSK